MANRASGFFCTGLVLTTLAPAIGLAQSVGTTPQGAPNFGDSRPGDSQWTVGLGLGVAPDYEGSEDYQAVPLWLVRYQDIYHPATYAQLFATKFKSNLLPDKNWRLGLGFEFVRKRDDVDNDRVDDLNSASESFMVGAVGGYDFIFASGAKAGVEIDARVDIANGNGYLITPGLTYSRRLGESWFLNSGLSTTYASGDYMTNYFGIDAADSARSGLDQYDADGSFKDVSIDAGFTYAFNERWTTTLIAQYKILVGDAKDSPVVDDEGNQKQLFGGFTVNYSF